ncbi:MAG: hypothetical protein ACOX2R_03375 [Anaerolineae bacterium]|jgi:hypothetical protein
MRQTHVLRRIVLASLFVVLPSPLYFVAWWTNFQALGPPFRTPPEVDYYYDHWYLPLLSEHWLKIVVFVIMGVLGTAAVVGVLSMGRRGRLLTALWLWLVGCWSSLVFTSLWGLPNRIDPWVEWLLGLAFISTISAVLPAMVAFIVSLFWLAISSLVKA